MFKALAEEQLALAPPSEAGAATPAMRPVQRDFVRVRADMLCHKDGPVPKAVDRFFDELVHDSHASFYMAGPVTEADRQEKIAQIARKYDDARHNLGRLVSQGRARLTPDQVERVATLSLSELELSIHRYQKEHPGEFPPITDADREQLLAMETLVTSAAVRLVTNKTRRELGGHVRYRRILDKS